MIDEASEEIAYVYVDSEDGNQINDGWEGKSHATKLAHATENIDNSHNVRSDLVQTLFPKSYQPNEHMAIEPT